MRAVTLKNRKCKLWNKYIRSKASNDYPSYCQVRNELRNLTRHLRINYGNKSVLGAKENPRQLWKLLNDYFASVFTREDLTSIPSFYVPQVVEDPIADIEFTPRDVYVKMSALNPAKSIRTRWLATVIFKGM